MTKIRILVFLLTIIVVGTVGYVVSLYARGYRFDTKTFSFTPNGILVIKSEPDAAQVFIDGDFVSATNATLPLAPGVYDVSLHKEGYLSWHKTLTIEKEVVTQATAYLFRSVPSLTAITFLGVENPVASSDYTKIAYAVPPPENPNEDDRSGLWIIETVNLPFGFNRDPRQITDGNLIDASWEFSPDSRQILLTTALGAAYLLPTNTFTPVVQRENVTTTKEEILASWELEKETKLNAQIRNLPLELVDILTNKSLSVVLSPDETIVLYTASASGQLPENLIKQLPGASTQSQERNIKEGHTYIYDIKEDRNFLISDKDEVLRWFPTSRHAILVEEGKITIMDYDGTNRQEIYSGSYIAPHAFPFADAGRLIILTNLGADSGSPNFFSLGLK